MYIDRYDIITIGLNLLHYSERHCYLNRKRTSLLSREHVFDIIGS